MALPSETGLDKNPDETLSGVAIDFFDNNIGYIAGGLARAPVICKTEDGGEIWIKDTQIATEESLTGIFFLNNLHGWMYGDALIETTDGGKKTGISGIINYLPG